MQVHPNVSQRGLKNSCLNYCVENVVKMVYHLVAQMSNTLMQAMTQKKLF